MSRTGVSICDQNGWIPGAARRGGRRYRFATYRLHTSDHLFDRKTVARAEIECRAITTIIEIFKSADMGIDKIGDVNVVPDCSAIRSRIVGTVYFNAIQFALCCL